jgi:hypothetical protein
LGLGIILKFTDSLMMGLGSLFFWLMTKKATKPKSFARRAFVDNQETLAAGVIAGGSIIGLIILILENTI